MQLRKWLLTICIALLPFSGIYAQCSTFPKLKFQAPSLQSGTAKAIGAVYKFTGVIAGVDAFITILQAKNASVQNFDDDASAYIRAWQPTIRVTSTTTVPSWVKFKIEFKKTAGTKDTIPCLAMGVVDCDGTSSFQERISTLNQTTYSTSSSTGVTFNTDSFFNVNGDNVTYASIDTTAIDAMAQVNYANVNTIIVKIGAIGTCTSQDRQNCLYFQQFSTLTQTLPVSYNYFDATVNGNRVTLDWETLAEHNNDHFDIERSSDGENFVTIGNTEGAGNSDQANDYQYTDNVTPGIYYYRLKQVDYNGAYKLSTVSVVHVGITKITDIKVNPNPVNTSCSITFYSPVKENDVTMTITNSYGQIIQTENYSVTKGDNGFNIDFATFVPGLYFVALKTKNDIVINRIVKL